MRILLVGADERTAQVLQTDTRCEVIRARHWPDSRSSIGALGDPARFDLIIHQCYRSEEEKALPVVHDDYLEEATSLGAVTVEMVTGSDVVG